MHKISVSAETSTLKSVIVGYPDNFLDVEPEIINETQKRYYFGADAPQPALVIEQLNGLTATLEAHGVEVLHPHALPYLPDQLMTRDIGVVIGNTFIVTSMAAASRRMEWRAICYLFEKFEESAEILVAQETFVLEGGDVVVDKGKIFVGFGQRTNQAGVDWLTKHFPEFEVVPVPLAQLDTGEDVLHLDCSFVPVGNNHALAYLAGMQTIPPALLDSYEIIEVTREEQQRLATNVFSISPTDVISRPTSERINGLMRAQGLNVIEVPFTEPPKTGGSFRCCTLPLWRE